MKTLKTLLIVMAVLASGTLAYLLVHNLAGNYLEKTSTGGQDLADCRGSFQTHYVTIQNDKISPAHTVAKLCDHLMLTNLDDKTRSIAFGPHDRHVHYSGSSGSVLQKNQSLTIVLRQLGTYRFHDHFEDQVDAYFTVAN